MGITKQMNIENRTYCFYDDMINIKDFDPNILKLDQKHPKMLLLIILDMSQKKINTKLIV